MMKQIKAIIIFYIFLVAPQNLLAVDNKPPHKEATTGAITGTLLEGGKAPLAGHPVVLEILQGHQLVLTIPKTTDEKGNYRFKNIFQTKDFSYAISTEYNGKIYRTDFISLEQGVTSRRFDLKVGEGVSTGPELPPPMPTQMPEGEIEGSPEHDHIHKESDTEYKFLAAILGLAALGYAIWQWKIKK